MTAWQDRGFWLRAAALLVLLAGLWLPAVVVSRPICAVTAVLDITLSMNVRDQTLDGVPASRIAMEKRAARALLEELPCGSRFGLAVFVERQPFLLFEPVETCANFSALDQEIAAVDWRMGWDSESHIGETLLASLQMARKLGSDLVFMTDGQETPPVSWDGAPDFSGVRDSVRGLVVGVGGHAFSPIPRYDTYGREVGVYRAGDVPSESKGLFRGREHLSAVDEPHLRALAAETGLGYRHLDDEGDLLAAYREHASPLTRKDRLRIGWVAGGLALMLTLSAMLPGRLLARRAPARRPVATWNFTYPSRKAGGPGTVPASLERP